MVLFMQTRLHLWGARTIHSTLPSPLCFATCPPNPSSCSSIHPPSIQSKWQMCQPWAPEWNSDPWSSDVSTSASCASLWAYKKVCGWKTHMAYWYIETNTLNGGRLTVSNEFWMKGRKYLTQPPCMEDATSMQLLPWTQRWGLKWLFTIVSALLIIQLQ